MRQLLLCVLGVSVSLSVYGIFKSELEFTKQHGDDVSAVTVGYAFSLIKCGDFQSTTAGLIDAALVMRHSIHQTSIRNPKSGSAYDYEMYAIVHRQALSCSGALKDAGIKVVVVDPPIELGDIKGTFLRESIHNEWCCGHDEFVKLYAYTKIPHPIVVHVDSDFFFLQPMDTLFDTMLYSRWSKQGREARRQIEMEFPKEHSLPARIDAFYTRDWPQVVPGSRKRKAGFQAGFLVLRPDKRVFDELVDIVREGNYVPGPGRGWGGRGGYVGFVGAMAMQGLLAYYYEALHPRVGVELNQCRYNWMGMDVRYRAAPNFRPELNLTGRCRTNREYCEDCRHTDLALIKNVHLTQCRKPWNCVGEGQPQETGEQLIGSNATEFAGYIDTSAGNLEQCLKIQRRWHELRSDLETKLYEITRDESVLEGRNGTYMPDVFMGHCSEISSTGYKALNMSRLSLQQVPALYRHWKEG